jgi:hypothetical protein
MRRLVVAALGAMLVLSATGAAVAATPAQRIDAELIAYGEAHPYDFEGLDALTYKYTGQHISVATNSVSAASGPMSVLSGIPNYTVTVVAQPLVSPPRYLVTGRWDFPDSWAGEGSPVDLAQLSFQMSSCIQMSNYTIQTYTYNGTSTNRGTLRSTAGFTGGLWNVSDYMVGFVGQADHGSASITLTYGPTCSGLIQVAAAFDYEANQGGGVLSVSPSFGFFSVSYSGSPLTNHQGTEPIYFLM